MLDFAKSILRFSWALSLLGMREVSTVLVQRNPQQLNRQLSDISDKITQAAVNQLDSSLQGIFRTGDAVQQWLANVASASFDSGNWSLLRMSFGAWQTPCKDDQLSEGWAPMSPPPKLDSSGSPAGGNRQ